MDDLQQYGHGGEPFDPGDYGECRMCRWCIRNQYYDGMANARAIVRMYEPDLSEQETAYKALAVRDAFFHEWAFCTHPSIMEYTSPNERVSDIQCEAYEEG